MKNISRENISPPKSRIILHIDMNAFYASCEMIANPSLRGKAIVVAHDDPLDRGIIVSPSYEARRYGVRAAMIVREAKKLCPGLIVVDGHYRLYEKYSALFLKYLSGITELVEKASIDEAYIDITALNPGAKTPAIAEKIQKDLLRLYHLPCSIGIAPNKFLAKTASDMKKPLGITVLRKREIPEKLWPLPIEEMLYIGRKTAPGLREIGIEKIGDLVDPDNKNKIIETFGINFYRSVFSKANGIDDSPVVTEAAAATSVSAAHTFMNNVYDPSVISDMLKVLVNTIGFKLADEKLLTENIGIQVRDGDYLTMNRSRSLFRPENDAYTLFRKAKEVFDDFFDINRGVRLLAVFCNRLRPQADAPRQISIFDDPGELEKKRTIENLIDEINRRYGENTIKKGF